MKKFFTLFAAAIMAVSASAQIISFTEDDKAAAGTLNEKTFSKDGFALTITDVVDGGKVNLDANNALFGTLDNYVQFTHRLKSGGKSSSKNCMALTVPSAGTLKVYARTATKDSERLVVMTQNGTEIFSQGFIDSQALTEKYVDEAGAEKTRTVFPIYEVKVEAGTIDITYPDGAINFYAFELVGDDATSISSLSSASSSKTFDLSGRQIANPAKGIYIKDGKKYTVK